MGCHSYTVFGLPYIDGAWEEIVLHFSDSELPCLCTFPHNNMVDGNRIEPEEVVSLALLGAALVLAHQGHLKDKWNYIPDCVPEWIRERVSRLVLERVDDE